MKPKNRVPLVKKLPTPALSFPPAWPWFVDEIIPAYVKSRYSPRESWKDKPFAKEDVQFFSKGVHELSELFTEDRPARMPAYFQHERFRSAYLLYFLPLQMAKFATLFHFNVKALEAALAHARKKGVLRVADLGAGPGTASLALLLRALTFEGEIPPIELNWVDTNRAILEDGERLALGIADQFPKLRGKVSVKIRVGNWWEARGQLEECSLILMGHVLNETSQIPSQESVWPELISKAGGGGLLAVEPAARGTSQFLSRLRDHLFETGALPSSSSSLWGPCFHAERCPLGKGKDYCHFSVPARVPGKWFAAFSKSLGSERLWLKFSYLWICAQEYPSKPRPADLRLVVSDPLTKTGEVLLCEPEHVGRIETAEIGPIWRGDVLQLSKV